MRLVTFACALVLAVCCRLPVVAGTAGKKILKLYGWDKPTTAFLRGHIAEIERVPLDGICVVLMPDKGIAKDLWGDDGNYLWWGTYPLTRGDFAQAVDDLRSTKFTHLTDNFAHVVTNGPRSVDWFDDAGFQQCYENARVLAWVCREGRLKGFTLDVENGPWVLQEGKQSFEEQKRKVRQRGSEWARAICSVYPDITIILTHSGWAAANQMEALGVSLEMSSYALLPSFIDGLLEGLGPRASIVDGCENTYPFMTYDTFRYLRRENERKALALSSVPDLYRKRMTQALGVWPGFPIDYGYTWIGENVEANHFTPERLEHALYNAMNASDKYVWVWNGANCWWPPSTRGFAYGKYFIVPDAYVDAVGSARKPKDLRWRPIPKDTGRYAAPSRETRAAILAWFEGLAAEHDTVLNLPDAWYFRPDPDDFIPRFLDQSWASYESAGLNERAAGWKTIRTGDYWDNQGYPYDGTAWYRIRFRVPDTATRRRLYVAFGGISGDAKVWVAAQGSGPSRAIGTHSSTDPFVLPAGGLPAVKDAVVIVRVFNARGPGGIAGPVKILARKGSEAQYRAAKTQILHLGFMEGTGDVVRDSTPFANHGSVHGAQWTKGRSGTGLAFDGYSSYLDCGNSPNLDLWENRVTWEVWFNPTADVQDSVGYHILVGKSADYRNGLYVNYLTKPNRVEFIQGNPEGSVTYPIPAFGQFYHIVGTYDGHTTRLYVNGELVGSRPNSIAIPIDDSPLRVGGGGLDAPRGTKGLIDEVSIYNWAMTPAEVRERFQAGASAKP